MKFSIVTVCLNPGEKLNKTLASVFSQTYGDWEVIVKDGGSTDGAVAVWQQEHAGHPEFDKVKVYVEPDKGIYDAMNQAVAHANGEYVVFLNCGDTFADENVLTDVAARMAGEDIETEAADARGRAEEALHKPDVFYGDTIGEKNGVVIASPPKMSGFTCYRNIPCHQSCFYRRELCVEKPYDLTYKIRADYDHFLWCFYRAKAEFAYLGFAVSAYEGGGYSESRANKQRDAQEFKKITSVYMSKGELLKYKSIMLLTLAPLRRILAESKLFSGLYHALKGMVYGK